MPESSLQHVRAKTADQNVPRYVGTKVEKMKTDVVKKVVALGEKVRHILVATADSGGLPHVAAAGTIDHADGPRIEVSAWFCPGTLANLSENRKLALIVWDPQSDYGYQLLGQMEDMVEVSIMNGFEPESKASAPMPQIERKLLIRVDRVLTFSHAPHSDQEE